MILATIVTCHGYDLLRAAGYWLQIFGLLAVAFGLWRTKRLFSKGDVLKIQSGIARAVGNDPTIHQGEPPQLMEIEGQIAALADELALVQERMIALEEQVKEKQEHTQEQLKEAAVEWRTQLSELRSRIKELAVSGLMLEGVGLLWLMLGLTIVAFASS